MSKVISPFVLSMFVFSILKVGFTTSTIIGCSFSSIFGSFIPNVIVFDIFLFPDLSSIFPSGIMKLIYPL